jgi:hypothetical protein
MSKLTDTQLINRKVFEVEHNCYVIRVSQKVLNKLWFSTLSADGIRVFTSSLSDTKSEALAKSTNFLETLT